MNQEEQIRALALILHERDEDPLFFSYYLAVFLGDFVMCRQEPEYLRDSSGKLMAMTMWTRLWFMGEPDMRIVDSRHSWVGNYQVVREDNAIEVVAEDVYQQWYRAWADLAEGIEREARHSMIRAHNFAMNLPNLSGGE